MKQFIVIITVRIEAENEEDAIEFALQSDDIQTEAFEEYPNMMVLAESLFYKDEAYEEGKNVGDLEGYANSCDTCLKPAEYMTCSTPELEGNAEGSEYYICKEGIKKYHLEDKVEHE